MENLVLKNSLLDFNFVLETIIQIEKDFQRCDISINLIGLKKKDEIEQEIYNAIKNLSSLKLQQLIYLVDINEKEFLKIMSDQYPIQSLSESILRREALKVYIRKNY